MPCSGDKRRKELEKYRQTLGVKRGYPEPLVALLVKLKDLSLQSGFANTDVASLVAPGDGRKLYESEPRHRRTGGEPEARVRRVLPA